MLLACLQEHLHKIGVELIQNMMPKGVRKVMQFISWAACCVFYALVIYYCAIQLPSLMRQVTPILKWPMGVIYVVMLLGLIMLTIYSAYLAVISLVKNDDNQEKKEKTAAEIAEEVE